MTKLDLSVCFHTHELDDASKELCTIATPFGLHRYKRLPQGCSQGPDVTQECIKKTLNGLCNIESHIDDVAIFSATWEEHSLQLDEVLRRPRDNGCATNPTKCEWAVQETDFLGHFLAPSGVKPWKKKVKSTLELKTPRNVSESRTFLGMVNWHRDMWPRRSHILAPLTKLTGKTFHWDEDCQRAFDQMKAVIATDALLVHPDHNLPFDIETDASDCQLGAVIKQNGRPVAHCSRELNNAQRNCTTIKKELLSVVETLREFRSMLLSAKLHIFTDHKNLTFKLMQHAAQRALRWCPLLEEFSPAFSCKAGQDNALADALSRLPIDRTQRSPLITNTFTTSTSEPFCSSALDEPNLAECLHHHPGLHQDFHLEFPIFDPDHPTHHPFHIESIHTHQLECTALKSRLLQNPKDYTTRQIGGTDVLMHQKGGASSP